MEVGRKTIYSDSTWVSRIHPAYETALDPAPNWRLPESNIRFIAGKDLANWQTVTDKAALGFTPSKEIGAWGDAPWNTLVKRPIPFWKDFGIKEARLERSETEKEIIYTACLPYNMQMTPIIDIEDNRGGNRLFIETDHWNGGSQINLRAEYVTAPGHRTYESLGWLNGQKSSLGTIKPPTCESIGFLTVKPDMTQNPRVASLVTMTFSYGFGRKD